MQEHAGGNLEGAFEGLSCSADLRLQILHSVPFFRMLSHEEVREINGLFHETGFLPGEEAVSEGDDADSLFIVARGKFKQLSVTEEGDEVIVDLLVPGDLFGGIPLLGQERYTHTVSALTASCGLGVSATDFERLLERYPRVYAPVLQHTARRLTQAFEQIRHLSRSSVQVRLAAILLIVHDKLATSSTPAPRLPLSQQELAQTVGSTVEAVNRALTQLRDDGLVETGRGWVRVVRDEELRAGTGDVSCR